MTCDEFRLTIQRDSTAYLPSEAVAIFYHAINCPKCMSHLDAEADAELAELSPEEAALIDQAAREEAKYLADRALTDPELSKLIPTLSACNTFLGRE